MRIYRLTIRGGGTRRSFRVPSSFSVGTGPGDLILLNHPSLDATPLMASKGRFLEPPPSGFTLRPGNREVEGPDGSLLRLSRSRWPLLLLLALLLALAPLAPGSLRRASAPPLRQDWTPLPLPVTRPLGLSSADRLHPRGVRFLLQPSTCRSQICFQLGGTGQGAVRLLLGGEELLSLDLPEGWGGEETVEVPPSPRERLLELRVDPALSPPLPWGVREVRWVPLPEGAPTPPAVRAGSREERFRALVVGARALIATGEGEKAEGMIQGWEEGASPAPTPEERKVLRGLRRRIP